MTEAAGTLVDGNSIVGSPATTYPTVRQGDVVTLNLPTQDVTQARVTGPTRERSAGQLTFGKLPESATQATHPPPILKFFAYEHLPAHLQAISAPIGQLAQQMVDTLPPGAELSAGLRKLFRGEGLFRPRAATVTARWALMLALGGTERPDGSGYRFVKFGRFTQIPGFGWGPVTDHLGRPRATG